MALQEMEEWQTKNRLKMSGSIHRHHHKMSRKQKQKQHVGELAVKPKGIDASVVKTLVNEYDLPRHRAANAASEVGTSHAGGRKILGGGRNKRESGGCIRALLSPGINNRDLHPRHDRNEDDEDNTNNNNNVRSSGNIGELAIKPVSIPVPVPKAGSEQFPFGAPQYTFETSSGNSHTKKKKFGLFRRGGGCDGSFGGRRDGSAGAGDKITAQQQSGQPIVFDDPIYRPNNPGGLATDVDVSMDSLPTFTPEPTPPMGNPGTSGSSTTYLPTSNNKDKIFTPVFPKTMNSSSGDGGINKDSSRTKNNGNKRRDGRVDPPAFDADFDSALGSLSSSSSSRPGLVAASSSSSTGHTTGSGGQSSVLSAAGSASTRSTSRSRSSSRPPVAEQRRAAEEKSRRLQQQQQWGGVGRASNTSFYDKPQQQQQQQTRSLKNAPNIPPRPATRKKVNTTKITARAAGSSLAWTNGTENRLTRRSSGNTESTGPTSQTSSAQAQTTLSESPKPSPPETVNFPCVAADDNLPVDEAAASAILETTANSFFDQSVASTNSLGHQGGLNPSEMATNFFAQSRSVSPRKDRPSGTPSSSARSAKSRSSSRGRARESVTAKSSGSGTRTGRSRSRSRRRRHRSKSRDGGASVTSSMSIDEESEFLDCLADHFPADVRTRDYELSKNSAKNARLLIDEQVRKIRAEREATAKRIAAVTESLRENSHKSRHVQGAAALTTGMSTGQQANARSDQRTRTVPPAGTSSSNCEKPGSHRSGGRCGHVAASLDAAAKALSLSEPFDEGPSGLSGELTNLSSEEAYVRGYGRVDPQSELHAFPRDEEDNNFCTIGEIMANGSSTTKQQQPTDGSRRPQTPQKDLIGKTPRRSPQSVSEWPTDF